MFGRLVHSDWSTGKNKRWVAVAERKSSGWLISEPALVGPSEQFLNREFAHAQDRAVLLGFDFPIGLPISWGLRSGLGDFLSALPILGQDTWSDFFNVAKKREEISLNRPFYPHAPGGTRRDHLVSAHGVGTFGDLLRLCEHRQARQKKDACSIFWTLGGDQVGKAAIAGWQEIVRPARMRGARLWPFDGPIGELSKTSGLCIAETYPALAYPIVGAAFKPGESKKNQANRRAKLAIAQRWADNRSVEIAPEAQQLISDGFGPRKSGEDPFDALFGLLKMIAVVDGKHPESSQQLPREVLAWEGWILGR